MAKRWTVLAGLIFVWNVSAGQHGYPSATELARRHPLVAGAVYLALGYHLAPWRKIPLDFQAGAADS